MLFQSLLLAQLGVCPLAPAGVYTSDAHPLFLRTEPKSVSYRVVDFYGHVREAGEWPEWRRVLETRSFGPGYFRLELLDGTNILAETSVSIVRERVLGAGHDPDAFFAMMATFARKPDPKGEFGRWLGGDVDQIVSRSLSLAGITEARVMWWWNGLEKRRGEFDDGWWRRAAEIYRERGIGLCAFGHAVPDWIEKTGRLPRDFAELTRFCRRMERANGASMTAWEFSNEPESPMFVSEGAWNFAAASKAAYLAVKAENPKRLVASAAFCTKAGTSGVDALWYESGGAYYSDFFNFHDYEIEPLPNRYRAWREMLSRYGIGDIAIWVTENGTDLEGSARRKGPDGRFYHDRAQEALHAEACLKGEFRLMQEGVFRCYHFYFSRFHERENTKDWGDFRFDGTLKPFYVAQSTAVNELACMTLEGRVCPTNGVIGYLFSGRDGRKTLVYWTETDVDRTYPGDWGQRESSVGNPNDLLRKTFDVRVPDGEFRQVLMTGESRNRHSADGRLSLVSTRYPAYVTGRFVFDGIERAHPRGKIGARKPEADLDTSVVIRADESSEDFMLGDGRTRAEMKGDGGRIRFEVWNLSDIGKTGSLVVRGADLSGVPETLTIPSWGKAGFDAALSYSSAWTNAMTRLEVSGSFDGKRTTPFVMPIFAVDHFFDGSELKEIQSWNDVGSWETNDSGADHAIVWDADERAIRIDVEFSAEEHDCWMFPRLRLPTEDARLLDGAKGVVFEIRATQTRVENQWKATNVMLESPRNPDRSGWVKYRAPTAQWERRMVDFADRPITHAVSAIALGGLPVISKKAAIWVRNIRVVR